MMKLQFIGIFTSNKNVLKIKPQSLYIKIEKLGLRYLEQVAN